jgi:hypothetical protein
VIGVEGQGQVVEDVGPILEVLGREAEVGDRPGGMLERQVGQSALMVGLGVIGGHLDDLIEPRQGLIRLLAGELERRDPEADGRRVRLEFQRAEVGGECLIDLALRLQDPALGQVGLGLVRVDLDGVVEPLQGRVVTPELRLHLALADQGRDVFGVDLEGAAIRGGGLGPLPLELHHPAEPVMGLGRSGRAGHQPLEVVSRADIILSVDGGLGALAQVAAQGRLRARVEQTVFAGSEPGAARAHQEGAIPNDDGPPPHSTPSMRRPSVRRPMDRRSVPRPTSCEIDRIEDRVEWSRRLVRDDADAAGRDVPTVRRGTLRPNPTAVNPDWSGRVPEEGRGRADAGRVGCASTSWNLGDRGTPRGREVADQAGQEADEVGVVLHRNPFVDAVDALQIL